MKKNQELISLGEQIHDAMKKFGAVRRTVYGVRPCPIASNLRGACVSSSYLLACEARKRNIPCEMIVGQEHAFALHDGIIYDPTYVQFILHEDDEPGINDPKVQVWKPGKIHSNVSHKYISRFKTTKESLAYIDKYHPPSSVDGYSLYWLSPTKAHISWSESGITINPIH